MSNLTKLPVRGNKFPAPGRFESLHAMGLSVIPLTGKRPAGEWKSMQQQRASAAAAAAWGRQGYNVGVVTGRISGLVVVDIDNDEAQQRYDSQGFPATPAVRTGRGRHYWFAHPGVDVSNRAGVDGLKWDVRGDGGYVVGPGSVHPDTGELYAWEIDPSEIPFAPLPERILATCRKPTPVTAPAAPVATLDGAPGWFEELFRAALDELAKARPGGRNALLNAKAYSLARRVEAAGVAWSRVESGLTSAALTAGLEAGETAATIGSGYAAGIVEPLDRPGWADVAANWDYIAKLGSFRHRSSGELLGPREFDMHHAAAMAGEKVSSPSKFLTSRALIANYTSLAFEPDQAPGLIRSGGLALLNIYNPPPIDAQPGDVSGFRFLMEHLFPDESERAHVERFLAHLVQRPGVKIQHALLIRSEAHGVGKGTLTDLVCALVGGSNSIAIQGDRLADRFNGWQAGKLLIIADEATEAGGWQFYNSLKLIITDSTIAIEQKGRDTVTLPNRASYIITTNRAAVLKLESEDRRFFVVDTPAQPLPPEHFTRTQGWWRATLPAIRHYLLHDVDLTNFHATGHAPVTDAKLAMIADSRSDLELSLERLRDAREGAFAGDLATLEEVRASLPDRLRRTVTDPTLTRAMKSARMAPAGGQTRVGGHWRYSEHRRFWVPGEGRARLWRLRHVAYWEGASDASMAREYAENESTLLRLEDALCMGPLQMWDPSLGEWGPDECFRVVEQEAARFAASGYDNIRPVGGDAV